jgi:hypothetical protein
MKFIGDAYSQGRGLPAGVQQSPDIAMDWYTKAKNAGYREAQIAIQDLAASIASNTFDASLFQNPDYMTRLYNGNFASIDNPIMFFAYTKSFTDELGGTTMFFMDPSCKGMVTALGSAVNGFEQLLGYFQTLQGANGLANVLVSAMLSSFTEDQGDRDAAILMHAYKCDNPITRRIVDNVIGSYQKLPAIVNATFAGGKEDMDRKRIEAASQGIAFTGSMFFPLENRDIPEPCASNPQTASCAPALAEFQKGSYGSVRCSYYNQAIDKTWNYFFWYKTAPYNIVVLAKNDPNAAIRALGTIPVQECPKAQNDAEVLYEQNNR